MHKLFAIAAVALLICGSCQKDEGDVSRIVTMTVASVRGYSWGMDPCSGPYPTYIAREGKDRQWNTIDAIEEFDYEPGYEYRLLVRKTTLSNPPADASNVVYQVMSVVGKTQKDSEGIPEYLLTPTPRPCN